MTSAKPPTTRGLVVSSLVGCFLTCLAATAVNLAFEHHGPFDPWLFARRLLLAYAAAVAVVLTCFPLLMPWLLRIFDR